MSGKLLCGVLLATGVWAQAPAGRWDGTAVVAGQKVPFRIDFEGDATSLRGSLVNGDARRASTSGSMAGSVVRLTFDGMRLEGTIAEGQLTGSFASRARVIPFTASAYCTCGVEGEAGPDIAGVWAADDSWWRFAVKRAGDDTIVSGLEVGPVSGRFDGIAFQLHYFDGIRAALLEVEPKNGVLALVWTVPGAPPKRYRAVKASQ
jgi:hypothetical protein